MRPKRRARTQASQLFLTRAPADAQRVLASVFEASLNVNLGRVCKGYNQSIAPPVVKHILSPPPAHEVAFCQDPGLSSGSGGGSAIGFGWGPRSGLLLAHFTVRGLMHEAACKPTRIPIGFRSRMPCVSSAASCRYSRRFPPQARRTLHKTVLDEILEERIVSGRSRQVPHGIKRKMSSYPLRPRAPQPTTRVDFTAAIWITK